MTTSWCWCNQTKRVLSSQEDDDVDDVDNKNLKILPPTTAKNK